MSSNNFVEILRTMPIHTWPYFKRFFYSRAGRVRVYTGTQNKNSL